ncbi:glucose-6-phosphate isomerase [Sneathiella marina]|uniref:Glucose-6-phosphate isomerase n=1 Tax=Sneathiella marina TaxID=2950108 RepID=A0ABY4W897_9PROT|nr:glucose-6-phosphate isomerase [Sneathiella marina]USG60881.1 glucose-6-phosphate isomerase [Sneathiella marina]
MNEKWAALEVYHERTKSSGISDLFDRDPMRFDAFSVTFGDMLLDFSKTSIDPTSRNLLVDLAYAAKIEQKRDDMFAGLAINQSEGRAVLHTALRNLEGEPVYVDGIDIMPGILSNFESAKMFTRAVRNGEISASDGAPFTDIVNIGIGGSDLGPAMVTRALTPYHDGPRCHFVSNVDGAQISDILDLLDPERTLFIIASKTFTTIETMTNAQTAKDWAQAALGEKVKHHFAAVSTSLEKTAAFGINSEYVFGFEDWVGGRYSVWGPIGLSVMLAIGPEAFTEFLLGAQDMDTHFQTAALHQNMPVMLALVGIWHNNICGYGSRAILPYDQRLARLPAYLQQLEMESNGKRVDVDGNLISRNTSPIIWGEPGTNGQHAFHQLLHQGSRIVPCEFLIAARSHEADLDKHHQLLLANCLAQSEALMRGRSHEEVISILCEKGVTENLDSAAAHRTFPGNRPSVTLLYKKLSPRTLGRIIALYEHRVFVEGAVWGLNSFDQWGVELGKELASDLLPLIGSEEDLDERNGSTGGLLRTVAKLRQ